MAISAFELAAVDPCYAGRSLGLAEQVDAWGVGKVRPEAAAAKKLSLRLPYMDWTFRRPAFVTAWIRGRACRQDETNQRCESYRQTEISAVRYVTRTLHVTPVAE